MLIHQSLLEALSSLRQAQCYAEDSQVDHWQFAVTISELRALGLKTNDLRWLIVKGYAAHKKETTVPGGVERTFCGLSVTFIVEDAAFVLTRLGAEAIRSLHTDAENQTRLPDSSAAAPVPEPAGGTCPIWHSDRRELCYRDRLVKRYRVPARNQMLILAVFEEEGWPEFIDDPLPPAHDIEPHRRLQATVKSLNGRQADARIRFRSSGGSRIFWNAVDE